MLSDLGKEMEKKLDRGRDNSNGEARGLYDVQAQNDAREVFVSDFLSLFYPSQPSPFISHFPHLSIHILSFLSCTLPYTSFLISLFTLPLPLLS